MSFKFKDYKEFEYTWLNGGVTQEGQKVEMRDALSSTDATLWMPKVINTVIREAVEPYLIGTKLLTRLNFTPGMMVQFPSIGAADGDFDMAESEEYHPIQINYAPGYAIMMTGKAGLALRFSAEMLRYSQYDVVNTYLRKAGAALARHKERKIFRMLSQLGKVTHDNITPASSEFGVTTGRALDKTGNGSLRIDDLFEAYASVLNQGYTPDLVLLHPLAWLMFVQDATLRSIALSNGGAFLAPWVGNPAMQEFPPEFGGLGAAGGRTITPANATNGTPSAMLDYPQNLTTAPQLPNYWNIPLKVVVSPYMPFDPTHNTVDIILADSKELGYYIEEHPVQTEEWKDPTNDITNIKLLERYTLGIASEGLGIAVLKNVALVPNEIVLPAISQVAITAGDVLDRNVAVV